MCYLTGTWITQAERDSGPAGGLLEPNVTPDQLKRDSTQYTPCSAGVTHKKEFHEQNNNLRRFVFGNDDRFR